MYNTEDHSNKYSLENWHRSRYLIWYRGVPQPGYSCCSAEAYLKLFERLSDIYIYPPAEEKRRRRYRKKPRCIHTQIREAHESVWASLQRGQKFRMKRILRIEKTRGLPLRITNPELLTWEEQNEL